MKEFLWYKRSKNSHFGVKRLCMKEMIKGSPEVTQKMGGGGFDETRLDLGSPIKVKVLGVSIGWSGS